MTGFCPTSRKGWRASVCQCPTAHTRTLATPQTSSTSSKPTSQTSQRYVPCKRSNCAQTFSIPQTSHQENEDAVWQIVQWKKFGVLASLRNLQRIVRPCVVWDEVKDTYKVADQCCRLFRNFLLCSQLGCKEGEEGVIASLPLRW